MRYNEIIRKYIYNKNKNFEVIDPPPYGKIKSYKYIHYLNFNRMYPILRLCYIDDDFLCVKIILSFTSDNIIFVRWPYDEDHFKNLMFKFATVSVGAKKLKMFFEDLTNYRSDLIDKYKFR